MSPPRLAFTAGGFLIIFCFSFCFHRLLFLPQNIDATVGCCRVFPDALKPRSVSLCAFVPAKVDPLSDYLPRITLQYTVLLSMGSCILNYTRNQFCGGRKPECPEETLEIRLRSTETRSTYNIIVEVEGVIDVHSASLTSQGVFYRDGHPSRYQPRPTGLNFGEQTGTGVFPLVIAVPLYTTTCGSTTDITNIHILILLLGHEGSKREDQKTQRRNGKRKKNNI